MALTAQLTHFGIHTIDLDRMVDFYTLVMGFVISDRGVSRSGANIVFMTQDPEGNPVELYCDTPFYTPQPCGEPLDLDQPNDAILKQTEAMCRQRPRFMSREAWMQEVQGRLAARQ